MESSTNSSSNIWQGRLVRLRGVEPGDAEIHAAWDQDSEMQRRVDRIHFPRSHEGTRRWAERAATTEPRGDNLHLEIETLAGELAGSISSHACDPRNGTFELGLAIRPAYQRRGYASEAVALMLRYFFDELRYQKANMGVMDFNEPSRRLVEHLGFIPEGRRRRAIYTDGRFHDMLLYGLTVEEFEPLRARFFGPEEG